MKTKIILLLVAFTAMLLAKPEWLTNPSDVYPQNQYLTAIGEGDSRAQAENMALRNMSKIFNTSIKAEDNLNETYNEVMNAEGESSNYASQLKKIINIKSESELFNVQYGERYTDDMGRVHTIAIINRAETGMIAEERLRRVSKEVANYLEESSASEDPIKKYAFLNAADKLNNMAMVLKKHLEIISSAHASMFEFPYTPALVHKRFVDAGEKVTFKIDIENDDEEIVKGALKQFLTDKGFVGTKENPVLKVKGKLILEPIKFRDDLKTISWTVDISIKDLYGQSIVNYSKSNRESSITWERAKARALREVNKLIKKKVMKKVNKYFNRYVASN